MQTPPSNMQGRAIGQVPQFNYHSLLSPEQTGNRRVLEMAQEMKGKLKFIQDTNWMFANQNQQLCFYSAL